MILVGEKLNSSIPRTHEAIKSRDEGVIIEMAKRQLDAGADWLDVNASVFMDGEHEALLWVMDTVQRATGAKLMIDSPSADAIAVALAADRVGNAIVNSVTLEEQRLCTLLPLVQQYNTGIVALPISPAGIPCTPQARLENANKLVERLTAAGIAPNRIYLDPLVESLSVNSFAAAITLETIRLIRAAHPDVNILCGLSNVSFGLPQRKLLNAAFLTGAILAGANAAILDPAEPANQEAIASAEALAGRDEFCVNYLGFYRRMQKGQA
jgi:5-methyltetrahydrofolate corrinoid/iron sulfur protein methyltransferase